MPLAVTFAQAAAVAGYGREDPLVIAAGIAGRRGAHLVRGCVPSAAVADAGVPPSASGDASVRSSASADAGVSSPAPADAGVPVVASGDSRGPSLPAADACAPGSRRLTTTTQVYVASLAKQFTAACAALLARDGILDADAPLADYAPDLPAWAKTVRIRHLIHHTSGLPTEPSRPGPSGSAGPSGLAGPPGMASPPGLTGPPGSGDRPPSARTTAALLAAARPGPDATPGTRFTYSNIGYVCLATAIGNAAGEPFGDFARRRIFEPLGMVGTVFWDGPEPMPAGAAPLDPAAPAPLSLGDGGMWSTAADLLLWCAGLNDDRLGITSLIQTPGRLDDGTELDYAWGVAVTRSQNRLAYRHIGSYADVRTMLVRVPEKGFDLVILALADRSERTAALTDALLVA